MSTTVLTCENALKHAVLEVPNNFVHYVSFVVWMAFSCRSRHKPCQSEHIFVFTEISNVALHVVQEQDYVILSYYIFLLSMVQLFFVLINLLWFKQFVMSNFLFSSFVILNTVHIKSTCISTEF